MILYSLIFVLLGLVSYLILIPTFRSKVPLKLRLMCVILSIALFLAPTLFTLFLFFEGAILPLLFIVISYGYNPERLLASTLLLTYTTLSGLPLFSILLIQPSVILWAPISSINHCWFYTIPFLIKLPLFMFHLWLPRAHVESPTGGSILLAALLLKLGSFSILRLQHLLSSYLWFLVPLITRIVVITSLQRDRKALVAYRRVAHINLRLLLLLVGSQSATLYFVITQLFHASVRGLMFFRVGFMFYVCRSRILVHLVLSIPFLLLFITVIIGNLGTPPIIVFVSEIITLSNLFYCAPVFLGAFFLYLMGIGYFNLWFWRNLVGTSSSYYLVLLPLNRILFLLFPLLLYL